MYLHLGGETVIPDSSVVAIYDLDRTTLSRDTRDFLAFAQKAGQIIEVSAELPKSFLISNTDCGETKVFLSPLTTATLMKRLNIKEQSTLTNNMISIGTMRAGYRFSKEWKQ